MAKKVIKQKPPVTPVVPKHAVYVGPNLTGDLPMTRYNVYKNGLPPQVKERFDTDPEFAKLFVPVADFAALKPKLKDPASDLSKACIAVLKNQKRR